jgi:hypothetical protein
MNAVNGKRSASRIAAILSAGSMASDQKVTKGLP